MTARDADTSTVVTHFRSRDGAHWTLCYDNEVAQALAAGETVERITIARTTTRELLRPATDDETLPPPMFDLGDTPNTDGPRSSGWYGGNE